jgi:hypothetical protein
VCMIDVRFPYMPTLAAVTKCWKRVNVLEILSTDTDVVQWRGRPPLASASTKRHPACAVLVRLVQGSDPPEALLLLLPALMQRRHFRRAARSGDVAEVQMSLDAGLDVNCTDQVGAPRHIRGPACSRSGS